MNKIIIKRPAVGSTKEMMMNIANSIGHTTVKLTGVRRSISFGDDIAQVEIESLEIGGACDDVIKTLELLSPQPSPVKPLVSELPDSYDSILKMPIGSEFEDGILGAKMFIGNVPYAIIVAPKIAEAELAWSDECIETQATSVNDGALNTLALLGIDDDLPAAEYCTEYRGGGAKDWYLASRAEMLQIAANKEAVEKAGLDGWYWTSTQTSADNAWLQRFSNGNQGNNSKTFAYRVRPVRRLKLMI